MTDGGGGGREWWGWREEWCPHCCPLISCRHGAHCSLFGATSLAATWHLLPLCLLAISLWRLPFAFVLGLVLLWPLSSCVVLHELGMGWLCGCCVVWCGCCVMMWCFCFIHAVLGCAVLALVGGWLFCVVVGDGGGQGGIVVGEVGSRRGQWQELRRTDVIC